MNGWTDGIVLSRSLLRASFHRPVFFFSSPSWTVGTVRFDLLIFFHEEGNNEGTDVSILESWAEVLAKSIGVLGAQVEPPFW